METGTNQRPKNQADEFKEALGSFQVLAKAMLDQNKRTMRKVDQLENDMISLMERQNAIEGGKHRLSIFEKIAFKLRYGKKLKPNKIEVTDESRSTDPTTQSN